MSKTSPRRLRRLLLTTGTCLLALLPAAPALAQAPTSQQPPAAAALTPPRLVKFVEAVYPPAARAAGRAAAVELELSLDDTGKVAERPGGDPGR